jgi:hypothetical protein
MARIAEPASRWGGSDPAAGSPRSTASSTASGSTSRSHSAPSSLPAPSGDPLPITSRGRRSSIPERSAFRIPFRADSRTTSPAAPFAASSSASRFRVVRPISSRSSTTRSPGTSRSGAETPSAGTIRRRTGALSIEVDDP